MVTSGGSVDSCRNFSQAARHGSTSPGGGDVGSSCGRAARLANPILNLAKTTGPRLVPLNARHEFFVQLAGKPDAKGELLGREIPYSSATT